VFTEQDGGSRGQAVELERYVGGFARRHPEVTVTTVRLAELLGSGTDSTLARYLALPVVPTVLGFDARVQVLHPGDAVAVLHRAVTHDLPGVFNAGGDGVLLLARTALSPDLTRLLSYGRVLDTTRLKSTFGYTPRVVDGRRARRLPAREDDDQSWLRPRSSPCRDAPPTTRHQHTSARPPPRPHPRP
jgi:UDP-glucose 4-epimerase